MNELSKKLMALLSFADDYPGDNCQFFDVVEVLAAVVDDWQTESDTVFTDVLENDIEACSRWITDPTAILLLADAMDLVNESEATALRHKLPRPR